MSMESEKHISKKTRSRLRIPEPIENLIANQHPFHDDDESTFLANFPTNEDTSDADLFKNFLLNTFGSNASNSNLLEDDHNDDDYNPLDYFDDLLGRDDNTDEKGRSIRVSKREAKDLQKDYFDHFVERNPKIDLSPNGDDRTVEPEISDMVCETECPDRIEKPSTTRPVSFYQDEPEVDTFGMNKEQYTTFLNQCHQQVQLLGQGLIMAHHDSNLLKKYNERKTGYLYETDEILFEVIGRYF